MIQRAGEDLILGRGEITAWKGVISEAIRFSRNLFRTIGYAGSVVREISGYTRSPT